MHDARTAACRGSRERWQAKKPPRAQRDSILNSQACARPAGVRDFALDPPNLRRPGPRGRAVAVPLCRGLPCWREERRGSSSNERKGDGVPFEKARANLALAPRYLAVDLASHASGVIVRWRAQKKKGLEKERGRRGRARWPRRRRAMCAAAPARSAGDDVGGRGARARRGRSPTPLCSRLTGGRLLATAPHAWASTQRRSPVPNAGAYVRAMMRPGGDV